MTELTEVLAITLPVALIVPTKAVFGSLTISDSSNALFELPKAIFKSPRASSSIHYFTLASSMT